MHTYWKWSMGGQKFYYPVSESDRQEKEFVDGNSPEGLNEDSFSPTTGAQARQTRGAQVLSMAQWKISGSQVGDYWVMDADGWAYWAAPLKHGEATGLLLKKVSMVKQPEGPYYYGINVKAQMATKDGGAKDNYEQFGAQGGWTEDAKALLGKITDQPATPPAGEKKLAEIVVRGGVNIGDTTYVKPGQELEITARPISYAFKDISVNNSKNKPQATEQYVLANKTQHIASLVFNENAPTGYILNLSCVLDGEEIFKVGDNYGYNWRYVYDSSKSAVVIPADSTGAVQGSDGKVYVSYDGGVYRVLNGDGALGPEVYALP